jgi:hypothetical protein
MRSLVCYSCERCHNRYVCGNGDPDTRARGRGHHQAAATRHFSTADPVFRCFEVLILQLGLQIETLTKEQLYDYGQNFIRTQLATVQGAAIPLPYGGKNRAIMVAIDPDALYAKHLSATDISNAMNIQAPVLPAGQPKSAIASMWCCSTAARPLWRGSIKCPS